MRLPKLEGRNFQSAFILVLVLGVGLRFYYMIAPQTQLSADETVYGVQALNILHGERSTFYYNQNYTGTLAAFISAFFFTLFGVQTLLVKLPILLFSIGFLFSAYFLAKKIFDSSSAGLAVLLLTGVTSPFWMNWTTRAGTGYPETMLLGNLVFILVLKNLFEQRSFWERVLRRSRITSQSLSFFLIGLLGGLGYWIQPTIVYYLLPASVLIFLWKPKLFLTRLFYLGFLGFLIGASPVVYFNLTHQNLNTASLFHKPFGVKTAMVNFFTVGLPIIFGVRAPFSKADFSVVLTVAISLIYLTAFLWLSLERLPALFRAFSFGLVSRKPKFQISLEGIEKIDLILIFLLAVFAIFSISSPFNQFIEEPRYVGALYSALPILVVYLVWKLKTKQWWLAAAVYLIVLGAQVYGLWRLPPPAFLAQIRIDEITNYLRENQYQYILTHADYSYRIVLETGGEIIAATNDSPPIEARYPEYKQMVEQAPLANKGLLLRYAQPLVGCLDDLAKQLGPCKETRFGDLYLYTWR